MAMSVTGGGGGEQFHILVCPSDVTRVMWTKNDTVKQLEHGNKPTFTYLLYWGGGGYQSQ